MWLSCGILNVEAMSGLMVMGNHTRWRMTDQLGFLRINTLAQGLALGWSSGTAEQNRKKEVDVSRYRQGDFGKLKNIANDGFHFC